MEEDAYAVAGAPESRYDRAGEEGCGCVETSGPGVLACLAAALPAGGRLLAVPWWRSGGSPRASSGSRRWRSKGGALAAGLVWLAAALAALARSLRP